MLFSLFYHGLNHNNLSVNHPTALRKGISVATADDPSYLSPVENALAGKGWRSNAIGRASYLSRTPGYGMIYAIWRFWLPEKSALIALLIFQMTLWALALTQIPKIANAWQFKYGFQLALFMAIWPVYGGFLSYTLTEGITPALVLLYFSAILRASPVKVSWTAILLASCILIIRPSLLPICLAYPIFVLVRINFKEFITFFFAIGLLLLPLFAWQLYISIRSGSIQSLHPIYQSDAVDLYRPLHGEIWNFHKSWGEVGSDFHLKMNDLWLSAKSNNSSEVAAEKLVLTLPAEVLSLVERDSLIAIYSAYVDILKLQQANVRSGLPTNGDLPNEQDLRTSFSALASAYRNQNWFEYSIVVPIKVFFRLSAHSNLNLYIFQGPMRGNSLVELIRLLSFALHLSIFLCFPFAVYFTRKRRAALLVGMGIMTYLTYLIFVQRGVEERYTASIFPLMTIFVFAMLSTWLAPKLIKYKQTLTFG